MPLQPDELADLRAARAGDRPAFARVHARWHRVVHAILLARLGPEDAEELVQEVFVTAWLRLPELTEPSAFAGWLCTIARHRAVDRLRVARPTVVLDHEPAAPAGDNIEVQQILATIRSLPEAYRETLLLRLVEGYGGQEIALRTGLTEGSVRVNLTRGMALLRERLGGAG